MPVPKRKHSNRRRNLKRAHKILTQPSLVKCEHCGNFTLPHRVCNTCGYYDGEQVLHKEVQ